MPRAGLQRLPPAVGDVGGQAATPPASAATRPVEERVAEVSNQKAEQISGLRRELDEPAVVPDQTEVSSSTGASYDEFAAGGYVADATDLDEVEAAAAPAGDTPQDQAPAGAAKDDLLGPTGGAGLPESGDEDVRSIGDLGAAELGTLEEMERQYVEDALRRCRWRINGRGNAAEVLGLHPNTLRNRMKKFGIQRPKGPVAFDSGRLSA